MNESSKRMTYNVRSSSVAEYRPHESGVVGSNPTCGFLFFFVRNYIENINHSKNNKIIKRGGMRFYRQRHYRKVHLLYSTPLLRCQTYGCYLHRVSLVVSYLSRLPVVYDSFLNNSYWSGDVNRTRQQFRKIMKGK